MENASKALIIAGSIVIVILLITMGIVLINSARNNVKNNTDIISQQSVQIFNN